MMNCDNTFKAKDTISDTFGELLPRGLLIFFIFLILVLASGSAYGVAGVQGGSQGKILQGYDNNQKAWGYGQVGGWNDCECIPFRMELKQPSSTPQTEIIEFDYSRKVQGVTRKGVTVFEGFYVGDSDGKPVSDSVVSLQISGPTYSAPEQGTELVIGSYTVTIKWHSYPSGKFYLYWCARLSCEASAFTGCSLHVNMKDRGAGDIPICVNCKNPTVSISDNVVCPGETAVFTAQTTGSLPMTYKWSFKKSGSNSFQQLSETGPTLKINNVDQNKVGVYKVKVSNSCGSSEKTAELCLCTGSLRIKKVVEGPCEQGTVFTVRVTGPYGYQDYRSFGCSGGEYTFTNLPVGEYTVSETPPNGWSVTGSGQKVKVEKDTTAEAIITNKRDTGSLKVIKSIDWNGATPDNTKTFEICIRGPSYPNGNCKTTSGGPLIWDNLLPGNYIVTEASPGTEWDVAITGSPATVVKDSVTEVSVVNKYKTTQSCISGCDQYSVTYLSGSSGYNPSTGRTRFTYSVCARCDPDISHWVLVLPSCVKASDIVAASHSYSVGTDPTTGASGIKFDIGVKKGECKEFWFELSGQWPSDSTNAFVKAGKLVCGVTTTGPKCPPVCQITVSVAPSSGELNCNVESVELKATVSGGTQPYT
ncbi:MSCRAMM family protein, partial [Methanothrix sp.]|uniref:MSCRAMM family protein n=1 Tax=Methanothrix sp. TaxID=90426 RepID=UPI003C76DDF0